MIATAAIAAALTLFVSLVPSALAYRAPEGHVAIETAASLVSLLVAFIMLGRFLSGGRLVDLLAAAALSVIGLSNLFFAVAPAAAGHPLSHWGAWSSVIGRLAGSVIFGVAAFVPDRVLRERRRSARRVAAACAALLAAIGLGFAFAGSMLPLGIDPELSPRPRIVGAPGVLVTQLLLMAVYAVAAVGYARRAERTGDRLMGWFALGAVVYAFAGLNYFLFPSLVSPWVYVGDFLRLAFFVVLLLGAASEIQRYQRRLADAAALEERRRLARELHDGLAQELAFIATQSRWLARQDGAPNQMDPLVVAAERALDESRSAISALTRPLDEPLDAALAQAAEDVAGRVGVRLRLDLDEGIEVPVAMREGLVRIVREAVTNTARHGNASFVTVQLSGSAGVRLSVGDDGIGFDPAERDGRGFGLTSMRERARALGGDLSITSAPGAGTTIEVVIP
jgi:signal transduction histidine kinase